MSHYYQQASPPVWKSLPEIGKKVLIVTDYCGFDVCT
jgi:hypothetical protein